jgi:kumamolisin
LDIEVAGAAAPGATIAVYFAPNTNQGFIDAINAAVHDNQRKPSIVSISWGGPEDPGGQVDQQFIDGIHQALQDAAQLGVTVCCASGDDGSADMGDGSDGGPKWDNKPHVDFPSSDVFALACGGTELLASGSAIRSEVVWNEGRSGGAGGGGVSNLFARPSYQANAGVPKSPTNTVGRGVPDLAGNADPNSGYKVILAGKSQVIGGTSAVAPLMAALFARINEQLAAKTGNSAGYVNPLLYGAAAPAFRDITQGNNDIEGNLKGEYTAGPGWDACSGQGVPDGQKLLTALGG